MDKQNQFRIQLKVAGQTYHVLRLQGLEKISKPFLFTVQFIVPGEIALQSLQNAQLLLSPTRTIAGVLKSISSSLLTDQPLQQLVTVSFTPLLQAFENYSSARVILDQSPVDVVKKTLLANGYREPQLKFTLNENYEKKPYILQAQGETHLDFINRLLAKAGIFYWSEIDADSGQEILHLADNPAYCSYLSNTVNYIAPSGLFPHADNSANTPRGFSKLELKYNAIVPLIQMVDHNEMRPQHKVEAQHGKTNGDSPSQYTHYGHNALDQSEAKKLAELHNQAQKSKQFQVNGSSNLPELAAGSSIKLAADGFSKLATGDYLITEIIHHSSQTIEQFGEENPYQNKITMVPRTINYKMDIPPHPPMPSLFHARIESNQENALLDGQGRYRARHILDNSNTAVAKTTPPIPRLQAYGGNPNDGSVGFHAPLLDSAEVLMGCIHGDPDRPVIYGTVPNPEQQSPVTIQNRSQHRFVSSAGHELLMDDKIDQEQIRFSNPNLVNHLTMDATKDNHVLTMATQQGEMQWQSKQQMQLKSDDSTTEIISNNKQQTATENFQTQTKNKDIHQQAATDHSFIAANNLQKQAQKNIEMTADGDLNWQSQQHLQLTSLGQGAQINVNQGSAIIQSAQHINVFGDGQGMMEFLQGNAGFQITPDGTVNLFGNNITVMSPNPVNFKGKINYPDDGAPTLTPQTIPDPLTGQPISYLDR